MELIFLPNTAHFCSWYKDWWNWLLSCRFNSFTSPSRNDHYSHFFVFNRFSEWKIVRPILGPFILKQNIRKSHFYTFISKLKRALLPRPVSWRGERERVSFSRPEQLSKISFNYWGIRYHLYTIIHFLSHPRSRLM